MAVRGKEGGRGEERLRLRSDFGAFTSELSNSAQDSDLLSEVNAFPPCFGSG